MLFFWIIRGVGIVSTGDSGFARIELLDFELAADRAIPAGETRPNE